MSIEMADLAKWLVQRAREPSTYAGLAALLLAFHVADASSWANVITTAGIGIAGVIAMIMKEAGAK